MKTMRKILAIALLGAFMQAAQADINIGVVGSFTGSAATLGADTKRAVALMPTSIAGEKVNYISFDDATDPTAAVMSTRKLMTEFNVDAIIGPNTNPSAAAMVQVADEGKTPIIVTTPYFPPKDKGTWAFQAVQSVGLMVDRIVEDMNERKVKNVGFIGFADSWGDLLTSELQRATQDTNIKLVASERYKRNDTSVTAQVLKLIAAKPDVIFIGASGTPAALPQIELRQRGYTGKIYQSHGASTKEFIQIGGKSVEGTFIPSSPILVAEQLPDNFQSKKVANDFNSVYEKANGPNSRSIFAAGTWDAWLLLSNAVPAALKSAKPGTPEFRQALRDNLEQTKEMVGVHGVYNMSGNDHNGLDRRARVLIEIKDGRWTYVK